MLNPNAQYDEAGMLKYPPAAAFIGWAVGCAGWFLLSGITLFVVPLLGLIAFAAPFVVATARGGVAGFAGALTGLGAAFLVVGYEVPLLHRLVLVGAMGIVGGFAAFAIDHFRRVRRGSAQ